MSYIFSIEKKRHLKQLVVHLWRVYILIFIKNMLIYLFILYIVLNPQSENDQNILLICKIWTVACLAFVILHLKRVPMVLAVKCAEAH